MFGLAVLCWATFIGGLVAVVWILRLPDGGFGAAHGRTPRGRRLWVRPDLGRVPPHHPAPARR